MTESPDELPYAYKEKLREDPDIYPAFLAVNGPHENCNQLNACKSKSCRWANSAMVIARKLRNIKKGTLLTLACFI